MSQIFGVIHRESKPGTVKRQVHAGSGSAVNSALGKGEASFWKPWATPSGTHSAELCVQNRGLPSGCWPWVQVPVRRALGLACWLPLAGPRGQTGGVRGAGDGFGSYGGSQLLCSACHQKPGAAEGHCQACLGPCLLVTALLRSPQPTTRSPTPALVSTFHSPRSFQSLPLCHRKWTL